MGKIIEQKLTVAAWLVLSTIYLATRSHITYPIFFGHKVLALFDLWSLQHFVSGFVIGTAVTKRGQGVRWWRILLGAVIWEAWEWSMEMGSIGSHMAYWFHGQEHWSNRLLSDPALYVIGSLIGARHPHLRSRMMLFSFSWIGMNLLAPHSMWFQDYLMR